MVAKMAANPLILALANPTPEILPEEVKAVRDDAIIATGRSDYPNQVNNVLCFPFIFRGALDVGATTITDEMKLAAVRAIAELARPSRATSWPPAYGEKVAGLRPRVPHPAPLRPAPDRQDRAGRGQAAAWTRAWRRGRSRISGRLPRSSTVRLPLRPDHEAGVRRGEEGAARVIYCEGEDERVLRAVQAVLDEGLAKPVLIGRPEVIAMRIEKAGLRIEAGRDFEVSRPLRSDTTLIGTMLLKRGYVDAMLCGVVGRHAQHLKHISDVIGLAPDARTVSRR
jgi:malate dehydrogenase (oxaloacetate-decarboxylating)(NADP+)